MVTLHTTVNISRCLLLPYRTTAVRQYRRIGKVFRDESTSAPFVLSRENAVDKRRRWTRTFISSDGSNDSSPPTSRALHYEANDIEIICMGYEIHRNKFYFSMQCSRNAAANDSAAAGEI
ncbi:hypothetical protein EVAR_16750_1 [Eumeta japonica]|uniref:Uncharacterized protein n=1 Tax=Eumeta variegata TaxID=151549 RepID=A0A4C1UM81_EUMVA|nr:hypothetical protein EVAR_16750_1 [Eumeta japonica]